MQAGIDPGDPDVVIEHCSTRGYSRIYCEEFLDPPSAVAVFVGGRSFYLRDWPPTDTADVSAETSHPTKHHGCPS